MWLLGTVAVLLAARCLEVRSGESVGLPGLASMPEICALKRNFCLKCPGCGLTRSFVYMAHGEVLAAWQTNWVGVCAFAFTVLQLPLALANWSWPGHRRLAVLLRWNAWALCLLAGLLCIRWASLLALGSLYAHA